MYVVAFIVALHLAFIGYVVIGGFLALRWRRTIWLHIPAVIWGAGIATKSVDCPLTWMERGARARAGMAPLPPDGFIAHYITGVIYPVSWVAGVQLASLAVIAVSWALYSRRWIGRRRHHRGVTKGGACDA
jgi:hypothetical protein